MAPGPLFRWLLHLECQKAVRLQYTVALVVLGVEDAGPGPGSELPIRRVGALVAGLLRGTDVVTVLSSGVLGLMLVDAERTALPGVLKRVTEPFWGGEMLVPAGGRPRWSAGAACYPHDAATARGLLAEALGLLRRARAERGAWVYLPS